MEIITMVLVATLIVGAGIAPQGFERADIPGLVAMVGGVTVILMAIVALV
jgi:hypothetical protein